jgi:hypothetical protein
MVRMVDISSNVTGRESSLGREARLAAQRLAGQQLAPPLLDAIR